MFSLSFKPPSAELAHIVNVPTKGELGAAARRPPSAELAYIANVSKGEFAMAHSHLVGKT